MQVENHHQRRSKLQSFTMNNGLTIPALGYGVFQMTSAEVAEHLPEAIAAGYRHIDTANAYFNEVAVGRVVRESPVAREEFFVTSKLFPQSYPYQQCVTDIDATLERLGLDHVDLLLFHQPYGEYVAGWRAMEEAVDAGKVRSIGLSNFSAAKAREILDVARIAPAVLQVEAHPYWNQHALKTELADTGIVFEAWYPLGHGDKTLLAEPALTEPAAKYGKTAAQVVLRWHLQEGNVTFPKTLNPQHMADNIDIFDFTLTEEEMTRINALPQKPYHAIPDEPPAYVTIPMDYSNQS